MSAILSGKFLSHYFRLSKRKYKSDSPNDYRFCIKNNGTPDKIRTCDPLIRSQILYPAELRVQNNYELRITNYVIRIPK